LSEEARRNLDWFTEMETGALSEQIKGNGLVKLTESICELIERFRLVQWRLLDFSDESGVGELMSEIDMILQYYESADYGDPEFTEVADEEGTVEEG
jgi:hypothetical protein